MSCFGDHVLLGVLLATCLLGTVAILVSCARAVQAYKEQQIRLAREELRRQRMAAMNEPPEVGAAP
jgi:hypothetical protein